MLAPNLYALRAGTAPLELCPILAPAPFRPDLQAQLQAQGLVGAYWAVYDRGGSMLFFGEASDALALWRGMVARWWRRQAAVPARALP